MIRNAIQRFMYGRYGSDSLNLALCVLSVLLYLLYWVIQLDLLELCSLLPIGLALFRTCSRNLAQRQRENLWFLQRVDPLLRWYRMRRTIRRDKEHRYFRCPHCGQYLRVPRGKGKLHITCPGCQSAFDERS